MWAPGERVPGGIQVLTKMLCSSLVPFWPLRARAGHNLGGH